MWNALSFTSLIYLFEVHRTLVDVRTHSFINPIGQLGVPEYQTFSIVQTDIQITGAEKVHHVIHLAFTNMNTIGKSLAGARNRLRITIS